MFTGKMVVGWELATKRDSKGVRSLAHWGGISPAPAFTAGSYVVINREIVARLVLCCALISTCMPLPRV